MPDDMVFGPDAMSREFPPTALSEAVKGTRREQLEAIRDYIAHELEGNRCNTCQNSKLRTGDQASLILRLQTVLSELDALGDGKAANRLAAVRTLHGDNGGSASEALSPPGPDQQRRTGSRRPGGGRRVGS